jgi:hypothetical protein
MSDATYRFFSVLRRGLAAMIPAVPAGGPRITVPASLRLSGHAVPGLPSLALRGPGDIIGFDASVVHRVWPRANSNNAEPNYFAIAELAEPDLPWRYSPAPSSGDRLTPWLCLVVVEEAQLGPWIPASRDRPLAVVGADAGALPDLSQAWAWAHAQLTAEPPGSDFDAASVNAALAGQPGQALARLICPRRLDPLTRYVACVVPTFERGRLAGLGQAVDGVDRLAFAWHAGAGPVTLPVYHSWRFQTGEPGDFSALVRLLVARDDLPDAVWERDLAVSPPGADPPAWQGVKLEGALRTLGGQHTPWPDLDENGYTAALAALVNVQGPVLAPPLYGRWLARASNLSAAPDAAPPWFHQLNGDPRARVAAGLGTLVVQSEQQELLAGAWAQVDGIRRVNQQLRLSQLARELSTRLHTRHFSVGGDAFLQLTAPLHGRTRNAATTARAQLARSAIVPGALGAAWRRVSRPMGSLGMRQGRPAAPAAPSVLQRLNTGALSLVPAATTATTTGAAARLGDLGAAFKKAGVTPEKLHTVALPHGFGVVAHAPAPATARGALPPVALPPEAAGSFAQAASALMAQLGRLAPGVTWVQADLDTLKRAVLTDLHPRQTIEAPLVARLSGFTGGPKRVDPLEPVMPAPEFPQAMYEPLARRSQQWIVPGLDQVPANTVATLATNWPFVEAYLVGLNHELARKLLWNGYPTDQRGTYFRHFWDIRGSSGGGDVGPIHQWTGALGANRTLPADPLVLLVRGELIRRYPNVVVYAAQAVVQDGLRQPGPTEKQPLFYARLEPDVALFGFDLDPGAARGDPGWFFVLQEHPSEPRFGLGAPTGAWGMQPATWQALAWDHLAATPGALAALRHVNLAAPLPLRPAAADPTGAEWHVADAARAGDIAHITFREPKRLAIHGSRLVPARVGPP